MSENKELTHEKKQLNAITLDIIRAISMMQILKYTFEGIKSSIKGRPKFEFMAANIQKVNAVNISFKNDMLKKLQPTTQQSIVQDINDDKLHDIALILDICLQLENPHEYLQILLDGTVKLNQDEPTN